MFVIVCAAVVVVGPAALVVIARVWVNVVVVSKLNIVVCDVVVLAYESSDRVVVICVDDVVENPPAADVNPVLLRVKPRY